MSKSVSAQAGEIKRYLLKEEMIVFALLIPILISFYASDCLNKYLQIRGYSFNRFSIIVRMGAEIIFICISLLWLNEYRKRAILLLIALTGMFVLGQAMLTINMNYETKLVENVIFYNKYIFVFIIYLAVYRIIEYPKKFEVVISILRTIFILNCLFAISGMMFDIKLFQSYVAYRFGYNGLIPAQNEATIFLILALLIEYHRFFYSKKHDFWILIPLFGNVISGTKASILFIILLMVFHLIARPNKTLNIVLFILAAILTIVYFSVGNNIEKILYYSYFAEKKGWIYMLTSGRDYLFMLRFAETLHYWSPINYLFGGQDQPRFLIEMDFIDLFLFFGMAGMLLYLYLYFKLIFRFNLRNKFNLFFVVSVFFIAFWAGHYFTSALNAIYVCLFCLYLQYHDTLKAIKHNEQA